MFKAFTIYNPIPHVSVGYDPRKVAISTWLNFESNGWLTSAATFKGQVVTITLNLFYGYASFIGLFDQYRFREIEFWLLPNTVATSTDAGQLAAVVDLDDTGTPGNMNTLLGYPNCCVVSQLTGGIYCKFVPQLALAAYQGAFTGYTGADPPWCDSTNPSIQFFGIKVGVDGTAGATITWSLRVRAHVEFRGVNP